MSGPPVSLECNFFGYEVLVVDKSRQYTSPEEIFQQQLIKLLAM